MYIMCCWSACRSHNKNLVLVCLQTLVCLQQFVVTVMENKTVIVSD